MKFKSSIKTKLFSSLVMAAAVAGSGYSPSSKAVAISGNNWQPFGEWAFGANIVSCFLLLPFCLLEEGAASTGPKAQDLLDNGYSQKQVDEIMAGQNAATAFLGENGVKYAGPQKGSELAQALAEVPGVTPEYLRFVRDNY